MGEKFQTERGSEYQYEFQKFCGYLSDGFRTKNKTQYFPDKEAHYRDKDSALFREAKTG